MLLVFGSGRGWSRVQQKKHEEVMKYAPPIQDHIANMGTVEPENVQVFELPIQPNNTSHELRATSSSGERSRGISERAAMKNEAPVQECLSIIFHRFDLSGATQRGGHGNAPAQTNHLKICAVDLNWPTGSVSSGETCACSGPLGDGGQQKPQVQFQPGIPTVEMAIIHTCVCVLLLVVAAHAVVNLSGKSHFIKRVSEGGIFSGGRIEVRQIGLLSLAGFKSILSVVNFPTSDTAYHKCA